MNLVVIGAQWGDEGKGKIVDFLADRADLIVRFSGGANAGHTIVHDGATYKLHLVPSGIVYPDKQVVLGSGMVIDPEALFNELSRLEEQGIQWRHRLFISDRAHLVLPDYRRQDIEIDQKRPKPIGTTGRGIGIAYAQKALRDGLRIADIAYDENLEHLPQVDRELVLKYRDRLLELSINIAEFMEDARDQRILFEGAQGVLLDLDIGTYPFVSSGSSCAAGAAVGCGIGPRAIDRIYGVFKAYSTRVGNGPFPSELDPALEGELETYIRETGREYGVTTGRPRRVGYLDLVALRYACRTSSIDSLVLTHLDVYDELDEIKVCVGYELDDETIETVPSCARALAACKPITMRLPGWKQSIAGARSFEDLPARAQEYVAFIEKYVDVPIGVISVGYERAQTILRQDPWTE